MGIDGENEENVSRTWMSVGAVCDQFQLPKNIITYQAGLVEGPDDIQGSSGSKLLDNAREASPNTPLINNDGTKGMSQTGIPRTGRVKG
jgi:hypothetical protein